MRFKIFEQNAKALQDFETARNALKAIGTEIPEHELALNKFADWTNEEYKSILGFKYDASKNQTNVQTFEYSAIPDSLNWVDKGKVTPVKD